jgi:aconitate hydratase
MTVTTPSTAPMATTEVPLLCRIDTLDEVEYFRNGGILQYVLRQLLVGCGRRG